MLTTLLLSTALAGKPAKPAKPVVADHTAQALAFGELMIGTSGVHFGVLPRIQLGTHALPFAAGLPNVAGRAQIIDHPRFDLAVDAGWFGSALDGLDLVSLEGSVTTSLHTGRISTHLGVHTNHFALEGHPTAAPKWVVGMLGEDPLAQVAVAAADANLDTAARVVQTRLRAAVEARLFGKSALVLQGSMAVGGSSYLRAAADIDGTTVDLGPGLPGARMLQEATTPAGSYIVSLAWQQQLGPLHFRVGYGKSRVPYAWIPQAGSLHLRAGGGYSKRNKQEAAPDPASLRRLRSPTSPLGSRQAGSSM